MAENIFMTGIGTSVGKTVVSAIVAEALQADYWKPIQAGYQNGTDSEWMREMISKNLTIHPEIYKLKLPASPHIAAREEGVEINLDKIAEEYKKLQSGGKPIVIEGVGGLLVPLNKNEKVIDLIQKLNIAVIVVSRNYLGSISHSLLTAEVLRSKNINTKGWIFNDQFMRYEDEIADWSGIPKLGSIPDAEKIDRRFITRQAEKIKPYLLGSV